MDKLLIHLFSKGGVFMLFVNCILSFVSDGARTFHDAAMGKYHHESEAIQQLREEMFGNSSVTSDAQNLRRDRMNVGHDVRVSFNKIVAQHE
jgi:hypothetical protein